MQRSIPFAIGALFVSIIGRGIYTKAQMAVAPPIYDPISYYIKAKLVWDALSRGDFAGTLNGALAIRPPGSTLLLYPLGFHFFIRGFPLSLRVCPDCPMDVGTSNYRCCICASEGRCHRWKLFSSRIGYRMVVVLCDGVLPDVGLATQNHIQLPSRTMFWARTAALKPLLELGLTWDDYPAEPLPHDGSLLHAIERILPFVVQKGGFRTVVTNVPGITR